MAHKIRTVERKVNSLLVNLFSLVLMQSARFSAHNIPLASSVPELRKMNHGFLIYASPTNVAKGVASYIRCSGNDVTSYNATHIAAVSQIQAHNQKLDMETWQHCG
jgi:hypothetical protein